MEEKILIKSEPSETIKNFSYFLWAIVALGFFIGMSAGDYEVMLVGLLISLGAGLIGGLIYWWLRSHEIIVTDKRVYGKIAFGKQVDLPVDSISAVGTSIMKGIAVATSSGKISFLFIKNSDDIRKVLTDLIIERQKIKNESVSVQAQSSDADELKKYKDLLDSGVITQEEFDAKKAQLFKLM